MGDRRGTLLALLSSVSVAATVALVYVGPIARDLYGDLGAHVDNTNEMLAKRTLVVPHFLFHLATAGTARLLGTELTPAAIGLSVAAQAMTCLLLVYLIRAGDRLLGLSRQIPMEMALLAGFALSFVGPLSIFSYPRLMLGFPAISTAHSPTALFLRPFALALFIVTLRMLASESGKQWLRLSLGAVVLALLGGLAKPSYNVCLAPGLALLLLWRYGQRRALPPRALATLAAIILPVVAITMWQFDVAFGPDSSVGVEFAPLKVTAYWSEGSRARAIFKLFLGIAFPLFIAVAYRKARACNSDAFLLSWASSIMSIASAYLFAETGRQMSHGNLMWSLQICGLILMTTSVAVLLGEEGWPGAGERTRVSLKAMVGAVLFCLHFVSGLVFVLFAPHVD